MGNDHFIRNRMHDSLVVHIDASVRQSVFVGHQQLLELLPPVASQYDVSRLKLVEDLLHVPARHLERVRLIQHPQRISAYTYLSRCIQSFRLVFLIVEQELYQEYQEPLLHAQTPKE